MLAGTGASWFCSGLSVISLSADCWKLWGSAICCLILHPGSSAFVGGKRISRYSPRRCRVNAALCVGAGWRFQGQIYNGRRPYIPRHAGRCSRTRGRGCVGGLIPQTWRQAVCPVWFVCRPWPPRQDKSWRASPGGCRAVVRQKNLPVGCSQRLRIALSRGRERHTCGRYAMPAPRSEPRRDRRSLNKRLGTMSVYVRWPMFLHRRLPGEGLRLHGLTPTPL